MTGSIIQNDCRVYTSHRCCCTALPHFLLSLSFFQEGQCKYNKSLGKVEVTGFYTVHTGKEDTLKRMIAEQGPAAVALDVERDFMMYKYV